MKLGPKDEPWIELDTIDTMLIVMLIGCALLMLAPSRCSVSVKVEDAKKEAPHDAQ